MAESLQYKRMFNLATAALYIATFVVVACMIGYLVGIDVLDQVSRILDFALIRIHDILFS